MTGIEIFLGGILLCNAILAGYMVGTAKRPKESASQPVDEAVEEENVSEPEDSEMTIPTSSFDVDKFVAELGDKFMAQIPRILAGTIGDVSVNEVEFADENTETPDEPNPEDATVNPARMDEAAIKKAFETDIRDVEDLPPSEPISSGASIDELEEAVEITLNDKATEEEKIKAGRVLQEYKRSQLFDSFSTNERIGKRVDLCIKLAIQADISTPRKKTLNKQKTTTSSSESKKPVPTKSSKASKSSTFNAEEYLSQYQA